MSLVSPKDAIKKLLEYSKSGKSFVPHGMETLSYFPFLPGHLYCICSRPAVGKTAFALTIAKNINCRDVFFSSAEMDTDDLRERLLKMGVDPDKQMVLSGKNKTIEDMVCALSNCTDVRAIFVDYLQLMVDGEEEYLGFVWALRRLAIALDVPVFLTAQLLPSVDYRMGVPCNVDLPFGENVEGLISGIIYLYDAGPYTDKGKPVNAFVTSKYTEPKTVELFFSTETFSFN